MQTDTLRKIYQELSTQSVNMSRDGGNVNGPIDTWAVFLDADVIIANPQYRIEDIIHHTRVVLKSSACEVISQLSLSTINTGVMMFRVSQISDILIQQWISLSVMGLIQSTDWQHEQGWFEYLYLLYLQRHIYGLYPFVIDHELDSLLSYEAMNCGFRVRKSNQHIGVRDVPLAVIRGRCFMKSLAIMEALPVQYESTSLLKSVFRVDNVQKELHMCMLTGLEIVNPLSSVISSIGFFNMHDWSGEDRFVSSGGNQRTDNHYVFQILDPRLGNMDISSSFGSKSVIDIEADGGMCGVVQPLFYHGKNESTRSRILDSYNNNVKINGSGTKKNERLRPVSVDGSCTRDLMHLLRLNADDSQWLSYGWQKKTIEFSNVKNELVEILTV